MKFVLSGTRTVQNPEKADEAAIEFGFIDARARREYIQLGIAGFFTAYLNSHSSLLAIVFAREHFDLHTIGLLISLYALPVILFTFLSGAIAARIGVLNTCRLAIALLMIGFFSLRYTSAEFWPAVASRLVQGVGQGLFLSSFVTYGQSRLNVKRFVYLLGLLSSMLMLPQAFAPPIGALVLNAFGTQAMFLEATVPACVGLTLMFGLRPIPWPRIARRLDFFSGVRRDRVPAFIAIFVNGTMFGFVTAYLAAMLEARAIPIAAFFLASTTVMFASRLFAMRSFEMINWNILVAAGFLLQGSGFMLVAVAETSWLIAVAGAFFGMGYSVIYPILSAWMSEGLEPNERAGPQALLNTVFSIGVFVMPYPQALIITQFGYGLAVMILASLAIVAACALFVPRFAKPRRS
ncbi:Major facilitator superfamily MFS_1 [Methylocella tundrae]|uniref:Major facilitator superfamily MFS_1 n=1 Tax=Methylocella tundrae TaxID=227605 RepID=A0A8B6M8E6_METTU|nr:MFS transporter [Methylocella tundrae]VTZ51150.1 Major facilitator superfamily MFS_1 [Methylocella tundrae]